MDGTVGVDGGWVRGHAVDGVWAFLGVPYARPPVGPLRWRPPQRPDPWSGVRDASHPGPLAPQSPSSAAAALPGDPAEQSEDCLHLSIWTPAPDASGRPVLVWVHGGGFTSGTSGSVLYRGHRLAAEGDVVVVNVNYRLGALGFLAHPALASDGGIAANWALLDQIAALRWVREHVASFGGDPSDVTVFGESAGAMCISTLLASPSAHGLFGGAVIQSGPPYVHTRPRALDAASCFARELGIAEISRESLESVPADVLVTALSTLARRRPRPGELPQPLLPVVDGVTLPATPIEAIAGGSASGIAVIVGTNRDEMSFFALSDPSTRAMDMHSLKKRIERSVPDLPPAQVVDHYLETFARRGERSGPSELWIAAGSDIVFRWPSLRLAAALRRHDPRTFVYLFTWESPAFGGVLGATHALEIPFVFGTYADRGISRFAIGDRDGDRDRGARGEADALSEAMRRSWVSFARSRDPSNDLVGRWPSWDRERRATMVFGRSISVEDAPRNAELALFESIAPLPPPGGPGVPSGSELGA